MDEFKHLVARAHEYIDGLPMLMEAKANGTLKDPNAIRNEIRRAISSLEMASDLLDGPADSYCGIASSGRSLIWPYGPGRACESCED